MDQMAKRRINEPMIVVKKRIHILLDLLKGNSHCLRQRVIFHLHIISQSGLYQGIMTTCLRIQSTEQSSSVKYLSIHLVITEEEVGRVAATHKN